MCTMRVFKVLSLTTLITAITTGLVSLTASDPIAPVYHCLKRATSPTSCYSGRAFDFIADIDGIQYEGNTGNYIDARIYQYGAYEKPNLFLLRDLMRSVYGGQGTFIDIGANTGQHSLMIARYSKHVHAFEPWLPVLSRFRHMVERNGIRNIALHPYGLGEENSIKPFYKPAESNLGTGSFIAGFTARDGVVSQNTYEGALELRRGDDAFEAEGITSVSVVKMDIEGYEKPALKGLRRTLANYRPVMMFELTTDPQSTVSIKSADELASLFPENYAFLVLGDASSPATGEYALEPIDRLVRFARHEQHDLLAIPGELTASIPRRGPSR
jgi:FkbM family methyltransferase